MEGEERMVGREEGKEGGRWLRMNHRVVEGDYLIDDLKWFGI